MEAVARFGPHGVVWVTQVEPTRVLFEADVCHPSLSSDGRPHGVHVHEYGDTHRGCAGTGRHYGARASAHGSATSETRHAGDLGNMAARDGCIRHSVRVPGAVGDFVGRAVVVHGAPDDLGVGGDAASRENGNAGERLLCAPLVWSDARAVA